MIPIHRLTLIPVAAAAVRGILIKQTEVEVLPAKGSALKVIKTSGASSSAVYICLGI